MRIGLATSLFLHGALLAWAMLSMQRTPELRMEAPEPIAVAMITPSEFLRMKQGSETATELEAKAKDEPKPEASKLEADKPKPVLAPTPPAEPEAAKPEPAPEPPAPAEPAKSEPPPPDPIAQKLAEAPPPPEPAPGPTPEELKKAEEEKKAEEQKKAEEKKKAEEQKKAEAKKKAEAAKKKAAELKRKKEEEERKKKATVSDRLAALLDKDPTKKGAPNSAQTPTKPTDYTGPTAGTATGNDTVLSVREQDLLRGMLRTQIARCWRLPGSGGGIETPIVTLRWRFRPDGTIDGDPRVEKPATGPLASLATESALRAVTGCQPYDLPQDLYDTGWKEVIWEFDPSQML